jgi:hypothetical protein
VDQMVISSGGAVTVGTDTAVAAALFQLESTTRGFLPPRMTTTQRTAITIAGGVATGLMVYDTSLDKLFVVEASSWVQK